jgi:hypothetical protein
MGGSRLLKFASLILYSCCTVSATLQLYRYLGDTTCALHTANGNWKTSGASYSHLQLVARCKEIGVCLGYEYGMVKRQISSYKLPWRHRGGVDVYLYSFLSLGARWGEWLRSRPGHFTPGKRSGTNCTGGWLGHRGRSGRARKISPATGVRSQDRPVRSESQYRLSHPGRAVVRTPVVLKSFVAEEHNQHKYSTNCSFCEMKTNWDIHQG